MPKSLMLFAALLAFCLPAAAEEPKVCGAPIALNDGWSIASQAELGLDPAKLCELDAFLAQWPQGNIHAVVVVRNGKLAMERYFAGEDERWGDKLGRVTYGPEMKHDLRSITKSVTSLLVGIALAEGKFPKLDSPVFDAFPDYADLRTPEKARITFRDLLTMSSGVAWEENVPWDDPRNNERGMIMAADPFRYILSQPVAHPPGTVYAYSGGGTSLLGETLIRSTDRPLRDYAREKLFLPIDAPDFEWLDAGVSGRLGAFGSLRLRPRDAAKLGLLLQTDGQWNGKQVVPPGWAAESIKPRLNGDGLYFYGYQWWLGRSLRNGSEITWTAGVGLGGQRLFVVPSLDLVVMINAGHYRSPLQTVIPSGILNRIVLPAVKD
ncbi:MAG: serine hydrolase [Reyranella sp.]|jgi:CubicO group peptidase (beta-lactamase class C family)|nr:serine hydrolase [Reyranella sp.]MBL6654073.1 serine hydrolase [Reyranella sp.]